MGESLKIQLEIKSGLEANDPLSRGFKGFMIMAFDATGQNIEPVGIFDGTTPNSEIQTMDCPTPSKGPNYRAPKVKINQCDILEILNRYNQTLIIKFLNCSIETKSGWAT